MTNNQHAAPAGFAGDVWGGLAAMLVALPSSIAFGVLVYSAMGPEHVGEGALAGFLGAAALGLLAPLVSRNGGFISAPCAPAAAVLSALALQLAQSGYTPARMGILISLTALLAALLQFLYGMVQAGRLIKFIPYQVVSGYLSGVAVLIATAQLPKLLGLPKGVSLWRGIAAPDLWNWTAIAVGVATIAAMTVAPYLIRKIPAAIIGLFTGIAAYFALAAFDPELFRQSGNPLIVGPIETTGSLVESVGLRLTELASVRTADIGSILVASLTLSLLLSIDTLKTGVVVDALLQRRHNANRELVGQGVANATSALIGGMPGAGTMGPTLVNINSGGRSPWSGIVEGALVVAAFVVAGNLIAWVPIGALAGLLLAIAWKMFDIKVFRLALQPSTRMDFAVIVAVLFVAQIDLVAASATGILLAILVFIRDQIQSSVIISKLDLRAAHSKRRRLSTEHTLLERDGHQAMVVQLHGNLFFGTTDELFSALEKDLETLRYLLLDLRRVQSMDFSAVHLLEQMHERLQSRDGALIFSGMPSSLPTRYDIDKYLAELGMVRAQGGIRVFDTRDSAIQWMEDKLLETADHKTRDQAETLAIGQIELFKGLEAVDLAELGRIVTDVSVGPGGRIVSTGEQSDEMFLIRRGRVNALLQLEGDKRHHLATFEAGDSFGELAFLDHQVRSADVEAETPTELYMLSRKRFDGLMQTNPVLCGKIFERLALAISRRLRSADTELRLLERR